MGRALVIGSAGQDGSYLCEQLAARGIEFVGLSRGAVSGFVRSTNPIALTDRGAIRELIGDGCFNEIYYLAGYHHATEDFPGMESDLTKRSFEVHVSGLLNILDAMVWCRSQAGLFYAASSHVFGVVSSAPQSEETPMKPICSYGVSKITGIHLCQLYRREHGLRAFAGLLYNHESPRRSTSFLSRKVVVSVAAIERGSTQKLRLGELESCVDWGYSPEYTEAMQKIISLDRGCDFIIASGRAVSIKEFVESAFRHANLDWRDYVIIDPSLVQKVNRGLLVGNPKKLFEATGWRAKTNAEQLAELMLVAERNKFDSGEYRS
jgi:GDPmannose 4,6-dehydratase